MNYCDGPIRPTKKEIEIDKNAVEKKDSFEKEKVKPIESKECYEAAEDEIEEKIDSEEEREEREESEK